MLSKCLMTAGRVLPPLLLFFKLFFLGEVGSRKAVSAVHVQSCVNCNQSEYSRQGCRSILQGKKDALQCKVHAVFIKLYFNRMQS